MDECMLPINTDEPQPVIFEALDAEAVQMAAKRTHGSGGPTLLDADIWKYILCSKAYGKDSDNLCATIAEFSKILATKELEPEMLTEYVACRLIPLDKGADKNGKIGVRPIGIGEVLRRIVGRVIMEVVRPDIRTTVGPIQTCAGARAGIEASIHAAREMMEGPDAEAVLLVDADNAFNRLNRKLAIHNTREVCPSFHRFIHNTYRKAANLYVNDGSKSESLLSDKGCTQGDRRHGLLCCMNCTSDLTA